MSAAIELGRPSDMAGTLGSQALKGNTNQRLSALGTAATFVGTIVGTLLLLAALTGIVFATLRYVSERSYRTLQEMESIRPAIAPR